MVSSINNIKLNRIAVLYRDLLSYNMHSLSNKDKDILLNIEPHDKIVAIGDIDFSNWNSYPLTYFLSKKLVAPVVLDESKVYQSIHAMRTHNESIVHPQMLISQCVVIRIIGLDSSPSINEYLNTFISMCKASDICKVIFIIFDGDKRHYKNDIYVRKVNSTFIDTTNGKPYTIDSIPLCILPDQITFFNYSRLSKQAVKQATDSKKVSKKENSSFNMMAESDFI